MKSRTHKILFILILSVCLVVPFSIDLFISGLPAISKQYPGENVSLLLSIALLGLALAQPIYGPLLDRYGRRPILLTGLVIYTLASAEIMLAHSFSALLTGRFIQAIGGCSAIIGAFAIVRDTYHGEELVKGMSLIMAMIGVSPALAPLIGSILNAAWGWRASFAFLFIIGCIYTLLIFFFFKETQLEKNHHALKVKNIIGNYKNLAIQSNFLKYCIISAFSYGILFSYFNLSSFFIIEQMGFHLINYGIVVAINALAIITMARVTPHFIKKIKLKFTLQIGLLIICCGGLILWISNLALTNLYTFMLPMFLITLGIGMIRPTASAGAMSIAPHKLAGSAAAFFNFISFVGGSMATVVTAKLINQVSHFGVFVMLMGISAILLSITIKVVIPQNPNQKIKVTDREQRFAS